MKVNISRRSAVKLSSRAYADLKKKTLFLAERPTFVLT